MLDNNWGLEQADEEWEDEGWYVIGWYDGGMDWSNNGPVWFDSKEALAAELDAAYNEATDTHLPCAEKVADKLFQEYELDALLGDFKDDYDVEGIIGDATIVCDGNRYWKILTTEEMNEIIAGWPLVRKLYVVYERRMMLAQRDERYVEMPENESAEVPGEVFGDKEDALAYLDSIKWDEPYEIVRTKRGLDTVIYNTAWVDEEVLKDGYPIEDPVEVTRIKSLPDEVYRAAMKHQSDYWDFLDYEEDYYGHIEV